MFPFPHPNSEKGPSRVPPQACLSGPIDPGCRDGAAPDAWSILVSASWSAPSQRWRPGGGQLQQDTQVQGSEAVPGHAPFVAPSVEWAPAGQEFLQGTWPGPGHSAQACGLKGCEDGGGGGREVQRSELGFH